MTALATNTDPSEVRWKYKQFTLASPNVAFQGAAIGYNPATQKVEPMPDDASGGHLFFLGFAVSKVDASSADKTLNVDLIEEVVMHWFANAAGGDAVAATDVTKLCYFIDDQTVTVTSEGNPVAGRVWAVDATKGVLVQKLASEGGAALASQPALAAFAAGDNAPAAIVNGAIYDVPTTAANSTITLPVAAPDGTVAYFVADGTKNGHTVTYRDATGPTALTTALTAAKRHLVTVAKRDGKWFANAYVSP
jgi:hypothetical protein